MTRTVSGREAFRIARAGLARMACDVMNPADTDHDHLECIVDDAAYAADVQLRLLAALSTGDEDVILERLSEAQAAIDPER